MRIDAPSRADVIEVASRMRAEDAAEFLAVSFCDGRDDLVKELADRYGGAETAFCAYDGDDPVAIGAMILHRPNVITAGLFATEDFHKVAFPFARFIRQRLFPEYRARGIHRIDALSAATHTKAHRWMETLGMREEARLRAFGRGGEDFVQFAWVKDGMDRPTGAA